MKLKRVPAAAVLTAMVSVMCVSASAAADMSSVFTARVYDTDGGGLALKKSPDIDSERILVIPEGTELNIDGVTSSGWGYTSYDGNDGWVSLRYTKAIAGCSAQTPSGGSVPTEYYVIYDTDDEGLELRAKPSVESCTFGSIEEGSCVLVRAVQGDWAYAMYEGGGWLNKNYLVKQEASSDYTVEVYDTENQGLSLKSAADIESERITVIAEGTELNIASTTENGWGSTVYQGTEGWVSLRYTQVKGLAFPEIPSESSAKPKVYTVSGTDEEGLEIRMRPDVESSSLGSIDDNSDVNVYAIVDKWAFVCFNGTYGWCNMSYLKRQK